METWKHLRAILLLPFMVTVVIPGLLLFPGDWDTLDLWERVPLSRFALPLTGLLSIATGLVLMVSTIRLFAGAGEGTLAPWNPTQKLVLQGVYRRVRNPMISGVFFVLLGEAVSFASLPLLGWSAFFIIGNAIYIPLSEEPGLVRRFGEEYKEYCRNVPRWIPKLKPWEPSNEP